MKFNLAFKCKDKPFYNKPSLYKTNHHFIIVKCCSHVSGRFISICPATLKGNNFKITTDESKNVWLKVSNVVNDETVPGILV